jgi:hypothetical protein
VLSLAYYAVQFLAFHADLNLAYLAVSLLAYFVEFYLAYLVLQLSPELCASRRNAIYFIPLPQSLPPGEGSLTLLTCALQKCLFLILSLWYRDCSIALALVSFALCVSRFFASAKLKSGLSIFRLI